MQIYGQEIDFRITRIDDAQRYKIAIEKLQEDEKQLQKLTTGDLTAVLESYIKMFQRFFINATGVDILAECRDAQEAHDAYISFLMEIKKAKKAITNFAPEDIE